ncbi:hypothetical protein DAMA08_043450 [Martiniozyma asiatica (nom. inval.)]|nr:hypothetical protein DAMA08_043450 [Martiniozyma asiatica]
MPDNSTLNTVLSIIATGYLMYRVLLHTVRIVALSNHPMLDLINYWYGNEAPNTPTTLVHKFGVAVSENFNWNDYLTKIFTIHIWLSYLIIGTAILICSVIFGLLSLVMIARMRLSVFM